MKKRFLSIFTALALCMSLLPQMAWAEELPSMPIEEKEETIEEELVEEPVEELVEETIAAAPMTLETQEGETGGAVQATEKEVNNETALKDAIGTEETVKIKLTGDASLSDTLTIPSGTTTAIELDLDGNTLSVNGDAYVIKITGGGTLTLKDSGTSMYAAITGKGGVYVDGGTFNMEEMRQEMLDWRSEPEDRSWQTPDLGPELVQWKSLPDVSELEDWSFGLKPDEDDEDIFRFEIYPPEQDKKPYVSLPYVSSYMEVGDDWDEEDIKASFQEDLSPAFEPNEKGDYFAKFEVTHFSTYLLLPRPVEQAGEETKADTAQEHTEDCYALKEDCVHTCAEDCAEVCEHSCSEESGCLTRELICGQEHLENASALPGEGAMMEEEKNQTPEQSSEGAAAAPAAADAPDAATNESEGTAAPAGEEPQKTADSADFDAGKCRGNARECAGAAGECVGRCIERCARKGHR